MSEIILTGSNTQIKKYLWVLQGSTTMENIRIFNDCDLQIETSVMRGNCSAPQGLLSNAKQLSWMTEFSIRTEQPLKVLFLAYSSFDYCI